MANKTFVIGHVNPDTDSIASAMGYAWLLRERDGAEAVAARAGALNPQSAWLLKQLKLDPPALLTDAAIAVVEAASFGVLDYLRRMLARRPVSGVSLFPQYRAVLEAGARHRDRARAAGARSQQARGGGGGAHGLDAVLPAVQRKPA